MVNKVAMNDVSGQNWGQATEFPAKDVSSAFTRLA
jgi:hypothetical protein